MARATGGCLLPAALPPPKRPPDWSEMPLRWAGGGGLAWAWAVGVGVGGGRG